MLAALKFLVGFFQHVFLRYFYKNLILPKGDILSSILEKNRLKNQGDHLNVLYVDFYHLSDHVSYFFYKGT